MSARELSVVSDRALPITNKEFLYAIFGEEYEKAHVTAFADDPSDIEISRRSLCWGGGPAGKRLDTFNAGDNQYFTISLFHPLEDGRAVRRKAQFDACFVVVADDVSEKLPVERVELLPAPTYKLVTSSGSEQWGWVLDVACENRAQVENLLDGLVEQGLAPDGVDPGMKGVTRYVRLPEGSNTKAKRFVSGKPFKCYVSHWMPESVHSIESLASVFGIDLDAERAEFDGTSLLPDNAVVRNHPIFKHLTVTEIGNDNWIRVDCVNAAAHTADDPTGAAIRVMADGSLQYMCHHGHCLGEGGADKVTGRKAIEIVDASIAAEGRFIAEVNAYMMDLAMARNVEVGEKVGKSSTEVAQEADNEDVGANTPATETPAIDPMRYIFIAPYNAFYDTRSGEIIPPKGIDNLYLRAFPGGKAGPLASKLLLTTMDPLISSADGIGWKPTGRNAPDRNDVVFEDSGKRLINTWRGFDLSPVPGDVSRWLKLAEYLLPDEVERNVVLDFLAFLVQKPAEKPSFCIVHRGTHRIGKDLLYLPVMRAIGTDGARGVSIDNVMSGWGDYIRGLRMAIIEEVDKAQDHRVANAMKTVLAPTASGKRILNLKGGRVITQVDCTGYVMMSNKRACIAIERNDRRYFVVDSWIEPKEPAYYQDIDRWYRQGGGPAAVLAYLLERDISGFSASQLPHMTKGAQEMVKLGRYDYEQDLEMLIDDRYPPFHCDAVSVKELKKVCKEQGLKGGNNGIEEAMRHLGWHKFDGAVVKIEGKTVRAPTFYAVGLAADASGREQYEFFQKATTGDFVT